ncbi:DUF4893 domain-containing protein [Sphingomonas sp. BN140010]|uniref:DUF4893 domain-containing protein n=1 Tax=Sphingomonas arvum TaxID=2992113 RepID=A0ABT3JGG5_9SPHN|nr:DUF4893 domain-containing protein [Sphingomonas sp. BN140010]MCW3798148.1 DUF4893 domain-containing protein [Sphingomonas sp. BN140010]
MPRLRIIGLVTIALLGGCASPRGRQVPAAPTVVQETPTRGDAWRRLANQADADRIKRLGAAWDQALAEARSAGARRDIGAEGDLLRPDAGLARPSPTPGSYQCRMVRLGRTTARGRAFEKFKPFFCYVEVEDDLLTIVKQTGSQRPAGRLWEDDNASRLVFLGSLALGNEDQPKAYGEDPARDMAGVLERIGPFRWRLVIPWPRADAKLDVIELTPVANQPATS